MIRVDFFFVRNDIQLEYAIGFDRVEGDVATYLQAKAQEGLLLRKDYLGCAWFEGESPRQETLDRKALELYRQGAWRFAGRSREMTHFWHTLGTSPPPGVCDPRERYVATQAPRITLSRTRYLVYLENAVHQVRRDGVCDCGGTFKIPCPAIPLIQDFLAAGGARPLGHHPDTWPTTWIRIPPLCPVCDCPTTPDPYLNCRTGPGWRCSLAGYHHFWQVRTEPLRRYLKTHPPQPTYPWYDTPENERQAWLKAHSHVPGVQSAAVQAVTPTSPKGVDHALDRTQPREGEPGHWPALAGLDLVRLSRGCLRLDDRLLQPGILGRSG